MRRRSAQSCLRQRARHCSVPDIACGVGFSPDLGHSPRAFSRPGGSAASAAGFTLLEMMVVLAILGLATALVAPAMLRGIDSWQRQAALDALLDQIRALPGGARGSGRSITIDDAALKGSRPPLTVPAEWTLAAPVGWKVHANGVCEGGEISLGNAQGARTIRVSAPFCDPVVE